MRLQVCGSLGCCYTPWIQGDFDAGRPDFFSGPSQLEECNNFEFMDPDANTDIDGNLLMSNPKVIDIEISVSSTRFFFPRYGILPSGN